MLNAKKRERRDSLQNRGRKVCTITQLLNYRHYAEGFKLCTCKVYRRKIHRGTTCKVYFLPCVSISNMETTFSSATARNCPAFGWNRTCPVPPCTRTAELGKTISYYIYKVIFCQKIRFNTILVIFQGWKGILPTFTARIHASWVTFQYRISPFPSREHKRSISFGWNSNDMTWELCPMNVCRDNWGCKTYYISSIILNVSTYISWVSRLNQVTRITYLTGSYSLVYWTRMFIAEYNLLIKKHRRTTHISTKKGSFYYLKPFALSI